ncbi:Crp/Fnr family transcriptional regulator [Paracoccus sp. (in: a-proteobacteria)]|uniref:Crp/Fnr family transcriptional regulator n=1 Tax=Paracoccus sp. TaxID=267 RepID=UPI003A8A8326
MNKLQNIPMLAAVPTEILASPRLRWSERLCGAGQLVIDRESSDHSVVFVRDGAFIAVYWTETGRELTFSRIGPGDYFGELAALDEGPRSISIYAQIPSRVVVIEGESFLWLVDEVPAFRARLLRDLTGRIRSLTKRLTEMVSQNVDQRVRGYLMRLALEQGVCQPDGVIHDTPTHAEIASYIGTNREAVSRVISELQKTGVINAGRQRLTILSPDALELTL